MDQHFTSQLTKRVSRRRSNRPRRRSFYQNNNRGYQGQAHGAPVVAANNLNNNFASSQPSNELKFFCQLAHGGPTAIIPAPSTLQDVYHQVASKFDSITADDILYCTVNTYKPEMDSLLASNLKLNDFIFAHVKGTRKEITLTKNGGLLGVTLTDNGFGKVFIKRIHEGSPASCASPAMLVGDHIEKVNGENVVDKRHYNVAAMLRSIPEGETFTVRLIEPMKSGFSFISTRSALGAAAKPLESQDLGDGTQTLRFRSTGTAVVEETPDKIVVNKVNQIFETYLGFNDDVLALAGWEIANKASGFVDLKQKIDDSDLGGFGFPEELLFDMWGIVDDWRKNRISGPQSSSTTTVNNGEMQQQ